MCKCFRHNVPKVFLRKLYALQARFSSNLQVIIIIYITVFATQYLFGLLCSKYKNLIIRPPVQRPHAIQYKSHPKMATTEQLWFRYVVILLCLVALSIWTEVLIDWLKINPKIKQVLPMAVVHNPSRFRLKTFREILLRGRPRSGWSG